MFFSSNYKNVIYMELIKMRMKMVV